MPELPEVETTRRGIMSGIVDQPIKRVTVRTHQLRWPVPDTLEQKLTGTCIESVDRRAKYLLLDNGAGKLIIHLGMSGSLRIVPADAPAGKHDHIDIVLADNSALRYTDPRKFGCMLWHTGPILEHPLFRHLGPEPFDEAFDGAYLRRLGHGRKLAVKSFIMDSSTVVGVGNIYANESLFNAGIRPARAAGNISLQRYDRLSEEIKAVLGNAIKVGGTTLRDFTGGDGKPGYFKQSLKVYGRGGEPCKRCGAGLRESRLGQRSTVYCLSCQS